MNMLDKRLHTTPQPVVEPDKIIIRAFQPLVSIGLFDHERTSRQPVSIDIELNIAPLGSGEDPSPRNIVRYDHICTAISEHIEGRHIDLVETLAEDVARICLSYARSLSVHVTVLKPEAVREAGAVGVSIHRSQSTL